MRAWVLVILAAGGLAGSAGASGTIQMPKLTHEQVIQLYTADDSRPPDEPALYALLENVASWDPDLAIQSNVLGRTPKQTELLQNPGAGRGEVYVIEGRFAGRQRRMDLLRRGPWGEALTEWGVAVRGEYVRGEGWTDDFVVMVYLINAEGEVTPPREGERVRVVARYFKVWSDVDGEGVPTAYPVFVGRSAEVLPSAAGGFSSTIAVIVGAIVALLAALFWVRRLGKRGGGAARDRVARRLREDADRVDDDDPVDADLPDDPAAALERLGQRGTPPNDAV